MTDEVAKVIAEAFADCGWAGDENALAEIAVTALHSAISEGRVSPEALGMESKVWHATTDFEPHPECVDGCRTVYLSHSSPT
ncbi:MAG: hypothetical protein M3404_01895 [Actinomycetota bacterium]|nr:hypothetical protein [Actinomycetota bacterium]